MAAAPTMDDNRRSRRFTSAATLAYFPFTSRKVRSTPVRVINCSRGGVNIHSVRPLLPGQTICCIHPPPEAAGGTSEGGHALLRAFALGEVRWCQPDPEGGAEGYAIGVKYI